MKIAIVTLTTTAKRTGVAEYIIHLLEGLQRIDKDNEYIVFTGRDNSYMFSFLAGNFREERLPLSHGKWMRPIFYFWLVVILPFKCWKDKINLVHLPNTMFVTGLFRTVSTIHDITELKTRKYSPLRTFFRWLMVKSAILRSELVLTVSKSSANDLTALGAKKILNIPLGFTSPFPLKISLEQQSKILVKYNLLGVRYVLFIGTLLKHKNVPTLIEAVASARKKIQDLELVIVGANGNDSKSVLTAINETGLDRQIHLLNFIDQQDKLVILKNASIFCFISSYEGFGIPVLEAQAAGVPVIVNAVSSLPEVGGLGAYYVNPEFLVDQTSRALEKLSIDEGLRERLVSLGQQNLLRFCWESFSESTFKAYQTLSKS
jgi:glycosyltransferase involved in cell wall biosynthesis